MLLCAGGNQKNGCFFIFRLDSTLCHETSLSNSIITFCVDAAYQIEKGKLHGCIDVGLSVMAIKKKAKCIDLDAEENIYHLKVHRKTDREKTLRVFSKFGQDDIPQLETMLA